MNLRPIGTYVLGAAVVACGVINSNAWASKSSSAVLVMAEMAQGKLSPAASQPGDMLVVKLKNDLKSNGVVLLPKGSSIRGVLRTVKNDINDDADNVVTMGQFRSIIEIEWIPPVPQGRATRNLLIALQSVAQVNSPVGVISAIGPLDPFTATTASRPSTRSQSNNALLSMPFVTVVNRQTSSTIEARLGNSPSGPLYRIGRGQLTADGAHQSVEIFSHLNNDTVITCANENFEISSGARMQLLVGVNKN